MWKAMNEEKISEICKALGDPNRLKIIRSNFEF